MNLLVRCCIRVQGRERVQRLVAICCEPLAGFARVAASAGLKAVPAAVPLRAMRVATL
jgi:hypothetical protein